MYRALISRHATNTLRARSMIVRHNTSSSASSAAQKTAESAKTAQAKATEALGSAQKGAEKVFAQAKGVSGKLGDTIGNLLGSYRQPLVYNLTVAREFLKQVYVREQLAPPTNLSTITSTYSTLFARARDVKYWQSIAKSGEWATVGIVGLEAYFIFHIGEMVGRRSIVGYKLDGDKELAAH